MHHGDTETRREEGEGSVLPAPTSLRGSVSPWFVSSCLLLLLAGCQKAGPYDPRSARGATEMPRAGQAPEKEPPLAPDLAWIDPGRSSRPDVRIVFVSESAPEW